MLKHVSFVVIALLFVTAIPAVAAQQEEYPFMELSELQEMLKVGTEAPDFEATRLDDGKKVKLSDFTAQSNVVLEFGSLT